jgi:DNA-binding cell septation regulator SpoVG
MQISKVTIRQQQKDNLRAFAEVFINNEIKVYGIRIYEGKNGLFVAMPQREVEAEDGTTKYYPYVKIDSGEARKEFDKAVLDAYHQSLETK